LKQSQLNSLIGLRTQEAFRLAKNWKLNPILLPDGTVTMALAQSSTVTIYYDRGIVVRVLAGDPTEIKNG
jgi:hypothetical protein